MLGIFFASHIFRSAARSLRLVACLRSRHKFVRDRASRDRTTIAGFLVLAVQTMLWVLSLVRTRSTLGELANDDSASSCHLWLSLRTLSSALPIVKRLAQSLNAFYALIFGLVIVRANLRRDDRIFRDNCSFFTQFTKLEGIWTFPYRAQYPTAGRNGPISSPHKTNLFNIPLNL